MEIAVVDHGARTFSCLNVERALTPVAVPDTASGSMALVRPCDVR